MAIIKPTKARVLFLAYCFLPVQFAIHWVAFTADAWRLAKSDVKAAAEPYLDTLEAENKKTRPE